MRRIIKKVLLSIGLILMLILSVVLFRSVSVESKQIQVAPVNDFAADEGKVLEHLSWSIQFQTVSYQDRSQTNGEEFLKLHKYLEEAFPRAHSTLVREVVNNYSLLYTWKGSEEGLKPVLLMGHLDVVPIEAGTVGNWTQPPFEG